MNEMVQMFENQEVKIKTDKGATLINLIHTAKCCGLVRKRNNNFVIRWTDVKNKLKQYLVVSGFRHHNMLRK